jgi:hypothetical protein
LANLLSLARTPLCLDLKEVWLGSHEEIVPLAMGAAALN